MYAWSSIIVEDKVTKNKFTRIPIGSKVTKSEVGADYDNLVACGVLRKQPYPKDVRTDESPRNAQLRKLNEEREKLEQSFTGHELDEEEDDDGGDTG